MRASGMGPGDRVTKREREVARLVAEGLTDREIAERLFVTRRTAEWHVEQLLAKLGVRSRTELAVQVARGQLEATQPAGRADSNLPHAPSAFIGRVRELTVGRDLLSKARLLTLTGVAGAGKTRLALEVAKSSLEAYADGCYFVDLTAIEEARMLPRAVAEALRVGDQPSSTLELSLIRYLGDKQVLLILDNCEHLIEPAAELVARILASTPAVRILATSREPMHVLGESIWVVPPLQMPGAGQSIEPDAVVAYDAIRLYLDRARRAAPEFEITRENVSAVVQLCRRLDGIPLAIELAATQVNSMSPVEALERTEAGVARLGKRRASGKRQRSMAAAIDWSHDLLGTSERQLFRRLSVFVGSFSVESAVAVCADDNLDGLGIAELLSELVDKSMIVALPQPDGRTRYRQLDVIRQYAAERLRQSREVDWTRRRHLCHFLEFAERHGPKLFVNPRGPLERLTAEQDNFRSALHWAQDREPALAVRLSLALWVYWNNRAQIVEGRAAMEHALSTGAGDPAIRCEALARTGQFAWYAGDYETAEVHASASVAIGRSLPVSLGLTVGLFVLGICALRRGDAEVAEKLFRESAGTTQSTGLEYSALPPLSAIYALRMQTGEVNAARGIADELLLRFDSVRYPLQHCIMQCSIAVEELNAGNYARSAQALEIGLEIAKENLFLYWGGVGVRAGAFLAAGSERYEDCWRLLGASNMLRDRIPFRPWGVERTADHLLDRASDIVPSDRAAALVAEGERLTAEEAFDATLVVLSQLSAE